MLEENLLLYSFPKQIMKKVIERDCSFFIKLHGRVGHNISILGKREKTKFLPKTLIFNPYICAT